VNLKSQKNEERDAGWTGSRRLVRRGQRRRERRVRCPRANKQSSQRTSLCCSGQWRERGRRRRMACRMPRKYTGVGLGVPSPLLLGGMGAVEAAGRRCLGAAASSEKAGSASTFHVREGVHFPRGVSGPRSGSRGRIPGERR
jgi:hypothetical protein